MWSSWPELARILIIGSASYLALLVLLRGFGNRALAKMNAYDFVTTIALGSVLASAIVSKDIRLDSAVLSFSILLAMQRAVAWLSFHSKILQNALSNEPTLLVRDGRLLDASMRRECISKSDIEAAIRAQGHMKLSSVSAVILETDGSMSIIPKDNR